MEKTNERFNISDIIDLDDAKVREGDKNGIIIIVPETLTVELVEQCKAHYPQIHPKHIRRDGAAKWIFEAKLDELRFASMYKLVMISADSVFICDKVYDIKSS